MLFLIIFWQLLGSCMIFWLGVALRRYGHFLVIAGGCEEVLGDWEWLWAVVTIFWVVGDDWG